MLEFIVPRGLVSLPERLQRKPPAGQEWFLEDQRFARFVTGDPRFKEIFRRTAVFGAADVPVLIEGETGTGKELIAEILH